MQSGDLSSLCLGAGEKMLAARSNRGDYQDVFPPRRKDRGEVANKLPPARSFVELQDEVG